jgi:hypothetical protein
MDPVMLATAAITVIRPFLSKFTDAVTSKAADTATDSAGAGATALYRAIRKRLARDSYHQAILQGAEVQPDSEDRIDTLSRTLASILKADPEFANAIADLVGQTTPGFTVSDSGAVAGRDVNITATYAAGRDLSIGDAGTAP